MAQVWDGKQVTLFIDAAPSSNVPEVKGRSGGARDFLIGVLYKSDDGRPFGHFVGLIDEVRISNTVRYREAFQPFPRHEPDADTLALYHFDDGVGDVLRDASDNGHDGKIVGAKWVRADDSAITGRTQPGRVAGPSVTDVPPPVIAPCDSK